MFGSSVGGFLIALYFIFSCVCCVTLFVVVWLFFFFKLQMKVDYAGEMID